MKSILSNRQDSFCKYQEPMGGGGCTQVYNVYTCMSGGLPNIL